MNSYTKSSIYAWILFSWLITMIIFEYFTWHNGILPTYNDGHPIYASLIIFNQVFVGIFFYYGASNLIFPVYYQLKKTQIVKYENEILSVPLKKGYEPRVLLLYTTYNDFLPYAADQCFHQNYPNCHPVILDNSNEPHSINLIRKYVKLHPNVEWIHDQHNQHAKAGNLDHYLCGKGKGTYDYFVILDSDELLEPNFVEKCLRYWQGFSTNSKNKLGILQCNHISGQNQNRFQSMFSASGNSFWPVQNSIRSINSGLLRKSNYGLSRSSFGDTVCIELGHGTMISAECFNTVGKIPWKVAEDLCFSFEVLLKGFNIRFAHQIHGNESFPINQTALMIRSSKFCSANFEFFKDYGRELFKTHLLTNLQKLDLLSFTLSVPLFAFEYVSLLLSSIIFPLADINTGGQWFFLIPTLIAYFSQSITDGWFQFKRHMPLLHIIKYEFLTALLYGNMYYVTIKSTILALLGFPAKFKVTPKESNKIKFSEAVRENWHGILFSFITIIITLICSGSSWILLSFLPGVMGFIVYYLANQATAIENQTKMLIDAGNEYALTKQHGHVVPWNI